MTGIPTHDPQWEFTLLVRAALQTRGRYVAQVDTRDAQALVDIHWAARQAGRLMGVGVRVELSPFYGHADSTVTATVRYAEAGRLERVHVKEGLQWLLESVRAVQSTPGVVAGVPGPRQSALRDG